MPSSNMRTLGIALLAVGVVLLVIGLIYWTVPVGHLPAFLGHAAGSTRHHWKRALAATLLGLAGLIGGWVVFGKSKEAPAIG
jgi:hypothetical protein